MLQHLEAVDFRNFNSFDFDPGPGFNLIYGENGSGKTSILETLFLLSVGRSFRSRHIHRVIRHFSSQLSVFGIISQNTLNKIPAGIEKHRDGTTRIKIMGEEVKTTSELAKLFPLQLINQDSYQLLDSGPKYRRQFLDWGVFHVEHSFIDLWRRAQILIQQRNAELRVSTTPSRIAVWNQELAATALALDNLRRQYFSKFISVFQPVLNSLIDLSDFSINYKRGWEEEKDFLQQLEASFSRDSLLGYTQIGPHKADLQLKMGQAPVHEVLSRGEQKLLIYALRLAQGILLNQWNHKSCVYLIDDLPAELDSQRQAKVMSALTTLKTQVFVTGTALNHLDAVIERNSDSRVFHVEHSTIKLV